ncbi:S8/S53 family peptidase [Lentzea sp. NPDC051838]|uniref:S8/S53 family peptidase n=1 Tax=Lentzea sp. NPDC051838 TaxID=3154849 RepID=UPI0034432327
MTTTDEGAGQLVVDSRYLDAVRQVLDELGIEGKQHADAPAFDLTLLDLVHVEPRPDPVTKELVRPKVADLDPVLTELRLRLARRCGGWVPPLGKNRQMTSQFGAYPQTKSHALWDPIPVLDVPEGWLEGDEGNGIRVGLLDTAIPHHDNVPDDSIEAVGFTKATSDAAVYFEEGHGLFMAGLVLQEAPKAKLIARAALDDKGKASAWDVVKKLEEFFTDEPDRRVHVLVLASGCRTHDGKAPLILERAIERLNRRMTVVAAAGNHGAVAGMTPDLQITRDSPTWPAALPGVVAAGVPTPFPEANLSDERNLDYSPDLPWVTCTVNPGATGEFVSSYPASAEVEMLSGSKVDLSSGFASWRGTSCAAAQLGGALAARMATGLDATAALEALEQRPDIEKYSWTYKK